MNWNEFRRDLTRWAAHHLEHERSAFGLPEVPIEAEVPEVSFDFGANYITKGDAAGQFVKIVLDRAIIEAQDWLMDKIEEEGFFALYPLLKGELVFKLIAEDVEETEQDASSLQMEMESN